MVREAGDLACALFDRRGRMVAQANTGTPGHINSLAIAGAHLVRIFANRSSPGDVVITNDPWLSAGHFFDITVLTPIFDGDRVLAFIGSTIHHTDIGGYGIGAGARDVHEEGLWIPPLKLYNAGEPCPVLHSIIKSNVRTPDAVFGDLAAQVSSGQAASERLIAHVPALRTDRHRGTVRRDHRRSEAATRAAIRKLKPGTFRGESTFDVPGGQIITLKSAVTIDPDAGDITGRLHRLLAADQFDGINVVLNYTHAYSTFAIRSCLNPELPNNTGSLAPIKVHAPGGLDPQLQVSRAGQRPPCGRHVCADADPQGALSRHSGPGSCRRLRRGLDDADPGPSRRWATVHLVDVQLLRRHGRARDQSRAERHLLSDRRGRSPGRDCRGGDAGDLRPQGVAAGIRRRRRDARRRWPDHPVPAADQGRVAAQRGREPRRATAPRAWAAAGRARPAAFTSTASRCTTPRS